MKERENLQKRSGITIIAHLMLDTNFKTVHKVHIDHIKQVNHKQTRICVRKREYAYVND